MAKQVKQNAGPPAYVKAHEPTEDQLKVIRAKLRRARDLTLEIKSAQEAIKDKQADLTNIKRVELPELFSKAGISSVGLEPEGNMPGYDCKKEAYYRATIAAAWPEERRAAAFDWLKENGGSDLIKTEISILLPQKSQKLVSKVIKFLRTIAIDTFSVNESVPWASLTAFIRERYKRQQSVPLDVLGADVGEIVDLKPHHDTAKDDYHG